MIKKYPDFHLNVYRTHRTFANPQSVYDATKAQAGKVKLEGLSIKNYDVPGVPFPVPRAVVEEMYNHTTRFFGSYKACRDWLPTRATATTTGVGFCRGHGAGTEHGAAPEEQRVLILGFYDAPATLVARSTWCTIRSTTRAASARPGSTTRTNAGCAARRTWRTTTSTTARKALRTTDNYWGFQGAMDRTNSNWSQARDVHPVQRLQDAGSDPESTRT